MLKLEKVSKHYKIAGMRKIILDKISLEINPGEIISITGKSGSGKTTLLNVIAGITRPSGGSVFFNNKKMNYFLDILPSRLRNRKIGFVFQTFRLLPQETVWSNVLLPARIRGNAGHRTRVEAEELMKKLQIWEFKNMKAALLSGGQKQRTALARALVNGPDLILADEPTANLDNKTAGEINQLLIRLAKEGKAVLIVTHNEYMFKHSKKIYTLKAGKLEAKK